MQRIFLFAIKLCKNKHYFHREFKKFEQLLREHNLCPRNKFAIEESLLFIY